MEGEDVSNINRKVDKEECKNVLYHHLNKYTRVLEDDALYSFTTLQVSFASRQIKPLNFISEFIPEQYSTVLHAFLIFYTMSKQTKLL